MDKAKWRPMCSDFSFDALVDDFELKTEIKGSDIQSLISNAHLWQRMLNLCCEIVSFV